MPRRRRPPAAGRGPFVLDERDAWVIAYPDHVTAPGEAPLATLAAFLADHARAGDHRACTRCRSTRRRATAGSASSTRPPSTRRSAAGPTWPGWPTARAWMADAVVNHLSAASPWFRRFLDGDPAYADFFARLPEGADTTAVVRPRTTPARPPLRRRDGGDERDLDDVLGRPGRPRLPQPGRAGGDDRGAAALRRPRGRRRSASTPSPSSGRTRAARRCTCPRPTPSCEIFRSVLDDVAPASCSSPRRTCPTPRTCRTSASRRARGRRRVPVRAAAARRPRRAHRRHRRRSSRWAARARAPAARAHVPQLPRHPRRHRAAAGRGAGSTEAGVERARPAAAAAGGVVNRRATVGGRRRPTSWPSPGSRCSPPAVDEDDRDRPPPRHARRRPGRCPDIRCCTSTRSSASATTRRRSRRTGHGRDLNRGRHRRGRPRRRPRRPDQPGGPGRGPGCAGSSTPAARDPAFHPAAPARVLDAPVGTFALERGDGAVVAVELAGRTSEVALPAGPVAATSTAASHDGAIVLGRLRRRLAHPLNLGVPVPGRRERARPERAVGTSHAQFGGVSRRARQKR